MALALTSACAYPQLMLKLSKDSLYNYRYSGGDEFNTGKLDEKYWTNGLGWTRVLMSQDLSFNPNNVVPGKDVMKFIADKKDSLYTLGAFEVDSAMLKSGKVRLQDSRFLTRYSAGCIISKNKMHYGLYELRFKVEEGQGVWPAFWFFGGKLNEEIDAFELKGENKKLIHVDTHCPHGCDNGYTYKFSFSKNWGGWLPVNENIHNGFNLMQLEWAPDHVTWYFNGYPLAYYQGRFDNPMNLYLNTSVAKDGGPFKPGPNVDTKWPNTYTVDYIRVWKNTGSADTVELGFEQEFKTSSAYESNYKNAPTRKRGLSYSKQELEPEGGFILLNLGPERQLNIRFHGALRSARASITGQVMPETPLDPLQEYQIAIPADEKQLVLRISNGRKNYIKVIRLK